MYNWNGREFHIPAQAFELDRLFEKIGTTNKFCIDIGANDGYSSSNTRLLLNKGWTGLLVDCTDHGNPEVIVESVDPSNVNDILRECPLCPDLLSIDIDGNDYHVWKAIDWVKPRVVCIEYNAHFCHDEHVVMPFIPDHVWDGSFSYGASLAALVDLAHTKGYVLAAECIHLDVIFCLQGLVEEIDVQSVDIPFHKLCGPLRTTGPLSNHSIIQTRPMIDLSTGQSWGHIGHAINGGIPSGDKGQHGLQNQQPYRNLNVRKHVG